MTDTTPAAAPKGLDQAVGGAAPDHRFTNGLVLDVARDFEAHGYPRLDGTELRELHMHLWFFLHGRERGHERCQGRPR